MFFPLRFAILITLGLSPFSAFAGDHGSVLNEGAPQRYEVPVANDAISRKRKELADGVIQLKAILATQKDFPLTELQELLNRLDAQLNSKLDTADLLANEKMDEATQRLFLDSVSLILEYGIESLGTHMADPTQKASAIRENAAQNMKKKWEKHGDQREKAWLSPAKTPLVDLGANSPSTHFLWIGRKTLTVVGSGAINTTFIDGLTTKLTPKAVAPQITARPVAPVPAQRGELLPETRDFIEQIRSLAPDKQATAQKVAQDYEVARKDFDRWYQANIQGKSAGELGEELLRELKRRSEGVARLEKSLKAMVAVPDDFKEAVKRFKADPRKFAEEEADAYIRRLRQENPAQAKELEDMVANYKSKLSAFQAELAKIRGKKPNEIAKETLDKLRRESKVVANLEEDIGSLLLQFEEQKEKIEREVQKKVDELATHLDQNYKRVLDQELKGIDAELGRLGGEVEKARRDVEKDLKRLEGIIFGKK